GVRDGKQTKFPFNARTGAMADTTDPATWSSFDEAVVSAAKAELRYEGVGYVFSADDPYCGVDLDDCIDPATGGLKEWGQRFVLELDSYGEISPSGEGVKVFVAASKPGVRCKTSFADGAVEIYDRERFFTVTGRHLAGTPADVQPRQPQLTNVYEKV